MIAEEPPCERCKWFDVQSHLDGLPACRAFPSGIPEEILSGATCHTSPYPGDNGIKFEPKAPEKPARLEIDLTAEDMKQGAHWLADRAPAEFEKAPYVPPSVLFHGRPLADLQREEEAARKRSFSAKNPTGDSQDETINPES